MLLSQYHLYLALATIASSAFCVKKNKNKNLSLHEKRVQHYTTMHEIRITRIAVKNTIAHFKIGLFLFKVTQLMRKLSKNFETNLTFLEIDGIKYQD